MVPKFTKPYKRNSNYLFTSTEPTHSKSKEPLNMDSVHDLKDLQGPFTGAFFSGPGHRNVP